MILSFPPSSQFQQRHGDNLAIAAKYIALKFPPTIARDSPGHAHLSACIINEGSFMPLDPKQTQGHFLNFIFYLGFAYSKDTQIALRLKMKCIQNVTVKNVNNINWKHEAIQY